MKTKTIALFAAFILAMGFAGGCDKADAKPPAEGWGSAYLRIAQEYWGTPTLCTSTNVQWEQPPMWPGRWAAATAPTEPMPCVMWVDPNANVGAYMFCVIIVHEWSHWMGYQWGTDPNTIQYDGDANEDPWNPPTIHRCAKITHTFVAR